MERMKLIIAGGGSGGHFFPAMSVVQEIIRRDVGMEYLYVGTEDGIESRKWNLPEKNRILLNVRGFKNKGMVDKMAAISLLAGSIKKSYGIINSFKPQAVLGVGGYASFPLVITAAIMGIPTAVHEQNSIPGLANKILARFSKSIFISFGVSKNYFPPNKVVLTGLPVRFSSTPSKKSNSGIKTILILGGSQGAAQINKMMVSSLQGLKDKKDTILFIHQTGTADYKAVKDAYKAYGFNAQVYDFIDDMSSAFLQADIAISRAGASTLFELALFGIPCILIPYPHAASDHQSINAAEVANAGGAILISKDTDGVPMVVDAVHLLLSDQNRLIAMSESMRRWSKPDASKDIVDGLMRLKKA